MASVDIKDAYLHVPIRPECQKYLRMEAAGKIYQWKVLPFGLTAAPLTFTRIMQCALKPLHLEGKRVFSYLDDVLMASSTLATATSDLQVLKGHLRHLGFVLNDEKSSSVPQQVIEHLGFVINTQNQFVSMTKRKKLKLLKMVRRARSLRSMCVRDLARLLGSLVATREAIRPFLLNIRFLDIDRARAVKENGWSAIVSLSDESILELQLWEKLLLTWDGSYFGDVTVFQHEVYFDASDWGYGYIVDGHTTSVPWSDEEKSKHINFRELLALTLLLENEMLEGDILIYGDNQVSLKYAADGGTSRHLLELAKRIQMVTIEKNVRLHLHWIPSADNRADIASRQFLQNYEWRLTELNWATVEKFFPSLTIDLFATSRTALLPVYVSCNYDKHAFFQDAFSRGWENLGDVYLNPPVPLIMRVITKCTMENVVGCLVTPYWPSSPWFLKLKSEKVFSEVIQLQPQLTLRNCRQQWPLTLWAIRGLRK